MAGYIGIYSIHSEIHSGIQRDMAMGDAAGYGGIL